MCIRDSESSLGVDALSQDWTREVAWAAPPVSMVLQTAKKIALTRMRAILVVPLWPHGRFWTYLFPDGVHAAAMTLGLWTTKTKMNLPEDQLANSLLRTKYQNYLFLYLEGGGDTPWKPVPLPQFCTRRLFNKECWC